MKRRYILCLVLAILGVMLLLGAATVQPGRPISQYPRVTTLQGTDIFVVARTNVSPATNMGATWIVITNDVFLMVSNYVNVATNGFGAGDTVWTNNAGIIHPVAASGQATNSIQIYTNGGLTVGTGTKTYWGGLAGEGGETLLSLRNTNNGEIDYNEIFFGVQDNTNLVYQDFFVEPSINRRIFTRTQNGGQLTLDEYLDENTNFVYRAYHSAGDVWYFRPTLSGSGVPRYLFNTFGAADPDEQLFEWQNSGTNKMTLWGNGDLHVIGQITNDFLTASKIVLTDTGKGLVSSAFGETNLQQFATTNYVDTVATNNVKVTAGTNIVVVTNVSGNTITYNINSSSASTGAPLTPGVTNVASAETIIIDLSATNTPCISVTNVAAHSISVVVSNPYPGRWFSFYVEGSGAATNHTVTWTSVAGLQLKWLDAVTNTLVVSNGYVNVSGWVATMNRNTNMIITFRDE